MFSLSDHPHRRYNPLTGEWVLVSPHRTKRPWQGQVEQPAPEHRPAHDPQCYLCPGNPRAGGLVNPAYERTFVFTNDFAALLPDIPSGAYEVPADTGSPLLRAVAERGTSRVICYSPRHDLTMAEMEPADLRAVVDVWAEQYLEIGALDTIGYVQIFENRGAMMGASNPHPHGQIWATEHLPTNVAREQASQAAYHETHGHTLLGQYLDLELQEQARVVVANEHAVALVPFWATWPFETMVITRRPVSGISDLHGAERDGLADVLKRLTTRYDNLFQTSFPYSMGLHQRPTDGLPHPEWHFHIHFYPPLLRSATVRKFLVGFEMLAEAQRDITPEQAAERLRACSEKHFRRTAEPQNC
jgi:UDPglucose--hexose-1-phosphate uridylyltransferase